MSKDGIFDDMIEANDISLQQILNNLLDGSKDLDLKSHIFKPKQLASLNILSDLLTRLKYKKSSKVINDFIGIYLRYMVSFERLSRKEIIKALSNLVEKENENIAKLTTNLKQ